MVDVSEMNQANILVAQYNALNQALTVFYTEGTVIGAVSLQPVSGLPVPVNTVAYVFPPEVISGIEQMMWTQLQTISEQLTAMGITGLTQRSRADAKRRSK